MWFLLGRQAVHRPGRSLECEYRSSATVSFQCHWQNTTYTCKNLWHFETVKVVYRTIHEIISAIWELRDTGIPLSSPFGYVELKLRMKTTSEFQITTVHRSPLSVPNFQVSQYAMYVSLIYIARCQPVYIDPSRCQSRSKSACFPPSIMARQIVC